VDTRCSYCGSPITPDELTRAVCSSCGAVLPHAIRAQEQALAFRMMHGAPALGTPFVPIAPPAPPARSSSAVLVGILFGVMVVLGGAGAMVFLSTAQPSRSTAPVPRTTTALALQPCRTRASLRSQNSAVSATLTIRNDTTATVSLSWLDTNGRSVFYKRLNPAESYVQPTYATHPWLVEDASGVCQGIFVAQQGGARSVSLAAVRDAR